jgi:hypothetical protein
MAGQTQTWEAPRTVHEAITIKVRRRTVGGEALFRGVLAVRSVFGNYAVPAGPWRPDFNDAQHDATESKRLWVAANQLPEKGG